MTSAEDVQRFTGHTDWVRSCSFSPDGQRVVSGGIDGRVRVWEVNGGAQWALPASRAEWAQALR